MFMTLRYALVAVFSLAMAAPASYAQDVVKDGPKQEKSKLSKPSRDFLMLQFAYSGWLNAPDTVKSKGFGRAFNAYICYDFPIKNSNFSFAAGIGVGVDNIFLDNQEIVLTDNDTNQQARFIAESKNYKRYKVTTAYLEAPFELRFFSNKVNRNSGFKAAIGMRVGTLMGAHTKAKEDGTKIIFKTNSKRYVETWRFAGTARIGYGNVTLLGTYNFTNLYKDLLGPPITPYSIGICITGL